MRSIVAAAAFPIRIERRRIAAALTQHSGSISDDLRLFGTTFAAGFLFVSLLIA